MAVYTPDERETIINFNEADPTASVFTFNRKLINTLAALAATRKNECSLYRQEESSREYIVPKSWIKVRPPRQASEAQKAAARAALQKARCE